MSKVIIVTAKQVKQLYKQLEDDNTFGAMDGTAVCTWFNRYMENATNLTARFEESESKLASWFTNWMNDTEQERADQSKSWLNYMHWNHNICEGQDPISSKKLSEWMTARIVQELV